MASCKGITKEGHPCKNSVTEGEEYCWIHKIQAQSQTTDIVTSDPVEQSKETSLNRREFISPGRIGGFLRWLRDTIIGGVISNAAYEALKGEVAEVKDSLNEPKKSTTPSATPPTELKPLPEEVPVPTSTATPQRMLTPIPYNRLKQIRHGKIKDLKRANLRGADLEGANLFGANLRGADLEGANLFGANLRGADLEGANLSKANFTSVSYDSRTVWPENFDYRNSGAIGPNANLRLRIFSGCDLSREDLHGADFSGVNLGGTNLRGADLSGANLYSAYIEAADLSGADLRGANLAHVRYDSRTVWPENFDYRNSGAVGPNANFSGANLSGDSFNAAHLSKANFRNANLSGADLRVADLRGADLRAADLSGADLRAADLSGADLREANLERVKYDSHTKWPDVFNFLSYKLLL